MGPVENHSEKVGPLVEARQAVQQHLLVIIQNTTGPEPRQAV